MQPLDPIAQPETLSQTGQLLTQIAGLFNIFAGLLLAAGVLLFFNGLASYITHYGLPMRDEGLHRMHSGITLLFILIIMLGIVRFFQSYTQLGLAIVGGIIFLASGYAVLKVIQEANTPEEH